MNDDPRPVSTQKMANNDKLAFFITLSFIQLSLTGFIFKELIPLNINIINIALSSSILLLKFLLK
jgi:hypothetical protein